MSDDAGEVDLTVARIPLPARIADVLEAGGDRAAHHTERLEREGRYQAGRAGAELLTPIAWMTLTAAQLEAWGIVVPYAPPGFVWRCGFAMARRR